MEKSPPAPDLSALLPSNDGSRPAGRQPQMCGDIDMRIGADGTWYYGGTPIGRKELVKLFSTVLQRRDDGFWLITPAEQARIQVDDAPFAAVELDDGPEGEDGPTLRVRTNLDAWVDIGEDHPLRFAETPAGDFAPYVLVRAGLEARFTRAAYYDLVGRAVAETIDGDEVLGVWSGACFFPLGPVPDDDGDDAS